MAKIVIALGGNALGNTPEEQKRQVSTAAISLVDLIEAGHEIIVCHGNGPQVGMINLAFDEASKQSSKVVPLELPECTAMSQGYIGYHLQQAIKKEITGRDMPWHVATVVTQVEVEEGDPAFANPSKPIGSFYTKEESERLTAMNPGTIFKEDAGRGYRQFVASPQPRKIVEEDTIRRMLENEFIVITCGGGGIPVLKSRDGYTGVPAVIDKDFAAAKLAESIDADYLFILTAVDRVAINFGTADQQDLDELSVEKAEMFCYQGQFAPGSMLPKVRAAMNFARSKSGRHAVIASLEKVILPLKNGVLVKPHFLIHNTYVPSHKESTNYLQNAS